MPRKPRVTAEDYEVFLTSLCMGFRPGSDRDDCVREMTIRLLSIYTDLRKPPPPGLREFAESLGIETNADTP